MENATDSGCRVSNYCLSRDPVVSTLYNYYNDGDITSKVYSPSRSALYRRGALVLQHVSLMKDQVRSSWSV